MAKLDQIRMFLDVVRAGGFTAAATATGVPRSTLSLQVQALEKAMGVRLLKRSTRAVALTAEGQALFEQATPAVDHLLRSLDEVGGQPGRLRGMIRISVPADMPTEPVSRAIAAFRNDHPDVSFDVGMTNERADLVADNIDVAIRIGTNAALEVVERKLADVEWGFVASPGWLDGRSPPVRIADIECFISPNRALRAFLERVVLGEANLPDAAITVDNLLLAHNLAVDGYGVALLPLGLCAMSHRSGALRRILTEMVLKTTRLKMTYPTRADMVPRVRAFSDCLARQFGTDAARSAV